MPTQQQQIDYGNSANDGQGDPLRTAFIKTDDNFDAIWAAGPVGSNVTIVNTTIATVNTNGNLILRPNGIGVVQANSHVVPNTGNLRDLGSSSQRWRNLYVQTLYSQNQSVTGDTTFAGNVTVAGNLTVEGDTIQVGNIITDTLRIQLANTAANAAQADGAGITVGAADDLATLLFDAVNSTWDTNIGIAVGGPISGTSIAVSDATVYGNVAALEGNFTGNVSANYFVGNGSQLTGITVVGGSNTQVQFNDNGVLAGASGFTYNKVTGNVNIDGFEIGGQTISGTTANANITIHPDGSGVLFITGAANALVHVQGDLPDTQNRIRIENYGNSGAIIGGGEFQGQWTRGTPGSPQATLTDDKLAQFGGRGYNGTSYSGRSTGWISIDAADNWTASNQGTHISFWTTNIGSVVPLETMRLGANGNLVLYTGNLTLVSGKARFVQGGIDVAGNVVPISNNVSSLGSATNQWAELWVANSTIYLGGVPLGMSAGNVLTVGGEPLLRNDSNTSITTTGNITADYFIGNGSQLTNLPTSYANLIENGDSNVAISLPNGNVSVSANSATWNFDNTGNLGLPGGGIVYGNPYTPSGAPGNTITLQPAGSGVITDQRLLIYPTAADGDHIHIASGNLYQTELFLGSDNLYVKLANTGNIVINSNDNAGNTAQWTFDTTGNLTIPGTMIVTTGITGSGASPAPSLSGFDSLSAISANLSGNVTANYFIGDGSQLTGLPPGYTDSDVANLLASFGSNSISTTGNIDSGNITATYIYGDTTEANVFQGGSANISGNVVAGNFVGSGANVDIIAGSYDWTFVNDGNLLLPGNTFAVKYANGTAVSLGGGSSYGNANVADFLDSLGSNAIVTTGNITGGNINATANVIGSGYARFAGTFDESQASTAGLYLGYAGGTPRMMFGTGNTNQTLEIDNDGGILRFYKPGTTLATLTNTGDFSVTGNISGNTAGFAIGYRDIPQVTFSANATAALTDAGKHYYSTTAGNLALTLPDNSNVAFATGTALTIVVNAAGNVLVNQGTGVTLYQAGSSTTGNRVVGAYGMATVMKVAANTWVINGTGVY